MTKLGIASDHGGFKLKHALVEMLGKLGVEVLDLGTSSPEPCDYPDFAHALANGIQQKRFELGILVCGTGVGMSIAANKHRGVRATVVSDTYSARMAREHNDANVLCLGERVVGTGLGFDIVRAWLETKPSTDPRHTNRVAKLDPEG
jgi:ribose 5-phosphate isomerase B